jgi:uncharacterized membrane protein YkvA (DUF1232 family)
VVADMKRTSTIKLATTAAALLRATTRPGVPGLTERLHAVPRLVRATLDGSYHGTSRSRLGLVAAAVAYVVSPVDLMPEIVLPVVGVADDALVISWAVRTFVEETDRYLAWEMGQGIRPRRTVVRGTASSSTTPIAVRGAGGRPDRVTALRAAATDQVLEAVRRRLEP